MDKWVIEKRNDDDGTLDFRGVQPEQIFGAGAIHGMTADTIAKVVFRRRPSLPDGVLYGRNIPQWPSYVDPQFTARLKTW